MVNAILSKRYFKNTHKKTSIQNPACFFCLFAVTYIIENRKMKMKPSGIGTLRI